MIYEYRFNQHVRDYLSYRLFLVLPPLMPSIIDKNSNVV